MWLSDSFFCVIYDHRPTKPFARRFFKVTQNKHKWCKDITWEMLLFLFFVFCKVTFFSLFRLCKRLDARQTNCRSPTVLSSVTRISTLKSESDFWCASTQAVCPVLSNRWVYVSADSDVCIHIFDFLVDEQTPLSDGCLYVHGICSVMVWLIQ